jgi:fructokinase
LAFVSLDEKGERSFEFYRPPAADLCFSAKQFRPEWFQSTGIFHFCSNSLTEPDIFDATQVGLSLAKKNRWIISFDVNLRLNLWNKSSNPRERIKALLTHTDIVKLAKEELLFLTDGDDPKKTVSQILRDGSKIVLITDGGKPLSWYSQDSSGVITPEKVEMVDATAAGDAFMGGVLHQLSQLSDTEKGFEQWLKNQSEIEKTLVFASRCGAYAAAHKGAFPSLPTLESIKHFYGVNPHASS